MSSLPDHARKYKFDHDFFKIIDTEEKAYWLGFISSDGTIFKTKEKGYLLRIELNQIDVDHLRKFKAAIKSEHNTYSRKHYDKRTGKNYNSVEFKITSVELYADLEKLGIKTIRQFDFVPPNLLNHFIRGLIDGDGSFGFNYRNRNPYLSFVDGNYELVKKVLKVFEWVAKSGKHKILKSSKNSWVLHITGTYQVPNILGWMYRDSTVYLERKYINYVKLLQFLKENSKKRYTLKKTVVI